MAKVTEKIFLIKTQYDELVFKSASSNSYVINRDTGEYGIFIGNPRIRFNDFAKKQRLTNSFLSIYPTDKDNLFRNTLQNRWIVIRQAEKDLIDRVKREQGLK